MIVTSENDWHASCNESSIPQEFQHLIGFLVHASVAGVKRKFRRKRRLIGITDTGELLDHPGTGFGVQALAVALFADLNWRGYIHLEKSAHRFDQLPHLNFHPPTGSTISRTLIFIGHRSKCTQIITITQNILFFICMGGARSARAGIRYKYSFRQRLLICLAMAGHIFPKCSIDPGLILFRS